MRLSGRLVGDYLEVLTALDRLGGAVDVRIEPHLVVGDSDVSGLARESERTGIRLQAG